MNPPSTLARNLSDKYNVPIVELDVFLLCHGNTRENVDIYTLEFINKFYNNDLEKYKNEIKKVINNEKKFSTFVSKYICFISKYIKTQYIVEGVQIPVIIINTSIANKLINNDFAIIFKGTSAITSAIRMLKKMYNNGGIKEIKKIFGSNMINIIIKLCKWYKLQMKIQNKASKEVFYKLI